MNEELAATAAASLMDWDCMLYFPGTKSFFTFSLHNF